MMFQEPLYAVINKSAKPAHMTPGAPPVNNPQVSLMHNPIYGTVGGLAQPMAMPPQQLQPMGVMGQTMMPPTGMPLQPLQPQQPMGQQGGGSLL